MKWGILIIVFSFLFSCDDNFKDEISQRVTRLERRIDSLITILADPQTGQIKPVAIKPSAKKKAKKYSEDKLSVQLATPTKTPSKNYSSNSSYTRSGQCQGITKSGRQCRRTVKNGSYCWQHGG